MNTAEISDTLQVALGALMKAETAASEEAKRLGEDEDWNRALVIEGLVQGAKELVVQAQQLIEPALKED